MVKKFRRYLYSFWRNSRTWRTHRRTDGWRQYIRALCIASHGKNNTNTITICTIQRMVPFPMTLKSTTDSRADSLQHLNFLLITVLWLRLIDNQERQQIFNKTAVQEKSCIAGCFRTSPHMCNKTFYCTCAEALSSTVMWKRRNVAKMVWSEHDSEE